MRYADSSLSWVQTAWSGESLHQFWLQPVARGPASTGSSRTVLIVCACREVAVASGMHCWSTVGAKQQIAESSMQAAAQLFDAVCRQ